LSSLHFQGGTTAVIVGGTTGESATISENELRELVIAAVKFSRERGASDRAAGRMAIIAGAGTSSTASTLERVRWLGELGVDGVLVVTPAYVKPTQEGLFRHYEGRSLRSPKCRSCSTTCQGVRQSTCCLPRWRVWLPCRESSPSKRRLRALLACARFSRWRHSSPCYRVMTPRRAPQYWLAPQFTVLSGDDATARAAILAGAQGVISVTANLAPAAMSAMVAAARASDLARSAEIDAKLARLHEDLFVEGNPIPVKWALHTKGMIDTGIRLPLTPLSERFYGRVAGAMEQAGLGPA